MRSRNKNWIFFSILIFISSAKLISLTGCKKELNTGTIGFDSIVTDFEANSYKTVIIGDQEWMAENLKTTRYNDGKAIPFVFYNDSSTPASTDAYCWFMNISPLIPSGAVLWDGVNDKIVLNSNPDMSGNKAITFKLWLNKEKGYNKNGIFSLGVTSDTTFDNLYVVIDSNRIQVGIANDSTPGSTNWYLLAGLSNMILDCEIVKTDSTISSFHINSVAQQPVKTGYSTQPATFSVIGASAKDSTFLNDAFIWDIGVNGVGLWSGHPDGAADNAWKDKIGVANGVVYGSPVINASYSNIYGALYNWYSVGTGKLCPVGWHVPTDKDWSTLINYLDGESPAYYKLKDKGTEFWQCFPDEASNQTGFTALPAGLSNGHFSGQGDSGFWWSSTDNLDSAFSRHMTCYYKKISRRIDIKKFSYSVRCIKDN
jgi:uncharacterized protein (TIGR02145 family)